jgi:metallophosphoesterase superfamily enzyme
LGSETRIILPAFGAYTGGLAIFDAAFAALFDADTVVLFRGATARAAFRRDLPVMA